MPPIDGDKLRGHLEALILAALEGGDAHGLEILKRLEDRGCGLLRLKEGSLYPALYRLEAAREIEAVWEKQPHGRRGARRRIYRLTSKGKGKLRESREHWNTFVSILGGILAPQT
jgi:DNA-binding PadR family transcriptional regulator